MKWCSTRCGTSTVGEFTLFILFGAAGTRTYLLSIHMYTSITRVNESKLGGHTIQIDTPH